MRRLHVNWDLGGPTRHGAEHGNMVFGFGNNDPGELWTSKKIAGVSIFGILPRGQGIQRKRRTKLLSHRNGKVMELKLIKHDEAF